MRAVVVERYGPPSVARVSERPTPSPKANEIVVKVHAAGVSSGDARIRSGSFPAGFAAAAKLAIGIRGPRQQILGGTFAGIVTEVGSNVTSIAAGDRVAGMTGARLGCHAEFVCVRASNAAPIPHNVSDDDAAAALFGGCTALDFLRDRAKLQAEERLLVNGASRSVGSAAVQIGRALGATVSGVTSASNAELVSRLGATEVINYHDTPIASLSDRFDVVIDTVGNLDRESGVKLLAESGRLVLVVAGLGDTLRARSNIIAGTAKESPELSRAVLQLVAEGTLDPLTNFVGGLHAAVAAYEQIDSHHKVGNLVIRPQEN